MRIGFIGLGNMGSEMCRHLVSAGHAVTAWSRSDRGRERARELGANLVETPAALASANEAVITMVTGGADVEEVALGPQGIAQGGRAGLIHVDMSTISPVIARRVAGELAKRGATMLDAPVSGGPAGARAATLTIFAGGEREAFERMRPVLEKLGKHIFHLGPVGSGQVTKLANQICLLANLQGVAEGLLFARELGADVAAVREALLTGLAQSRMLETLGKKMVERDFAAGIVAALHHKDLGVALELAHGAGLPLPASAQVMQQLNALMGSGYGGQDTSSLLLVLEKTFGKDRGRS